MCVSLRKERNCSYYDRFKSAEREKLQLLRPLQVCRAREKLQLPRPLQVFRERETVLLYYDDRPPLNSQSPLPGASNQSRGGGVINSQHYGSFGGFRVEE